MPAASWPQPSPQATQQCWRSLQAQQRTLTCPLPCSPGRQQVRSGRHPQRLRFHPGWGLCQSHDHLRPRQREHQGRPQHESLSPVLQVRGQEGRKSGGGNAGGAGADDGPPSCDPGGAQVRAAPRVWVFMRSRAGSAPGKPLAQKPNLRAPADRPSSKLNRKGFQQPWVLKASPSLSERRGWYFEVCPPPGLPAGSQTRGSAQPKLWIPYMG